MNRSGASAFVYAKASGMLARSYVGKNADKLFEAKSLSDLWKLIFNTEVPLVPETLLADALEKAAEKKFVDDFIGLVSCYDNPDPIYLALIRMYEYSNLKECASALFLGETEKPALVDISPYSRLNFNAWPKIDEITFGTIFDWYNEVPTRKTQSEVDRKLDIQYTRELWKSVQEIPFNEREPVKSLIREELVLQNIIWALRLKVFYNMQDDDIIPWLASENEVATKDDVLAGPAIEILDKSIDSYSEWENWQYSEYLNPHEEGTFWKVDPCWFQHALNIKITKKAKKMFHQNPFSTAVLVAWFKIKHFELNCIRTAAEGLRMSVDEAQMKMAIL